MSKNTARSRPSPTKAELRARLDAVSAIARAINLSLPLRELLDLIAATTCQVMGYDFCAVLLAYPEHRLLLIEGAYGLSADYIQRVNAAQPVRREPGPIGEGPSSRAYYSQRPVAVPDVYADPTFVPWSGVALEQGYRSLISVPLVVQSGPLGVLNCYTKDRHDFSPSEVALLETIANQAAIAIEAASLHAREQATIERLEHQRALLERAEAIHRDLTRVVLDDEGLPAIAAALARLLASPVVVEDQDGHLLAAASCGDRTPNIPSPAVRADPHLAEPLTELATARQVVEVPPQPDLGLSGSCLIAPILISGELVGRLWVLDLPAPPGPLERRALEHGATVVALELLKQRTAQEVEWRLRGNLLGDLLSGEYSDGTTLLARLAYLGHDLSRPHSVIVARPDPVRWPSGQDPTATDQIRRRLLLLVQSLARRSGAHPLVAARGDYVVLLWPQAVPEAHPTPNELAELVRCEAPAALSGHTVSVAVGAPCSQPGDFARSYQEARLALDLALRLGGRNRLVSLEQLGIYRLLLKTEDPEQLARFAHRLLDPLEEYDRRHGSELARTLRAYLEHDCSVSQTAATLFIHPHTLAYRLRRIGELTGLDLRRLEDLLQIKLAFMVQDILSPA